MEIPKELIEKYGLQDEAVNEIKGIYTKSLETILPEKELEFENKYKGMANTNAEGIIGGAVKSVAEKFNLAFERKEGEKAADSLLRLKDELSSSFDKMKAEAVKGVDSSEYLDLKAKHEENLKKLANFDSLTEKASKYETIIEENNKLKNENAFTSVKPQFSPDANEFEVKAKWNDFKKSILEKYNIENVDGVYKAIDKENHHKVKDLADFIKESDALATITGVRNQKGLNIQGGGKDAVKKEGLPFTLPKDASNAEISAAINAQLVKDKVSSNDRDKVFAEYWKKAKA